MSDLPPSGDRLDSWKAIAAYLHRDVATVRRWEKGLGLPVRRVAGSGRSVFAYTSEIDAWLQTARPGTFVEDEAPPPTPPERGRRWLGWALVVAVTALVASLAVGAWPLPAGALRVEATSAGVVAHDAAGIEQWRYDFPTGYTTAIPAYPVQLTGGTTPGVLFATSHRYRLKPDHVEGGELRFLDLAGRSQKAFSFNDRVTYGGALYAAPWAVTGFAVDDSGATRRIAVTAHHEVWDPGLVTILDDQWQRRGTFVHAGWLEQVRWLSPERLLIGGYSNAREGGMLALLDPAHLDGQGPEPAGSRHHCDSCGPGLPLRMVVLPRSELNRVTASPFNRVLLQIADGRLSVRTIEMPAANGEADAIYEFTPALDLLSAKFSDRYWEMHRALEAEGRIAHAREACPDRDGPPSMLEWSPAGGWKTVRLR